MSHEEMGRLFGCFVWRAEDLVWPSCVSCQHKLRGPICEAYPDGILEEILHGKFDHKTPCPGGNGLTHLPATPEATDAEWAPGRS